MLCIMCVLLIMRGQSSFVQHNLVIALNMGVGGGPKQAAYIADKKPNYQRVGRLSM